MHDKMIWRNSVIFFIFIIFSGYCIHLYTFKYANIVAVHFTSNNKTTSVGSMDTIASRLHRLQNICNGSYLARASEYGLNWCFVNHERRIIHCSFPKVASTTWKLMMVMSTSKCKREFPGWNESAVQKAVHKKYGEGHKVIKIRAIKHFGLDRLDEYSAEQIRMKFKDYFKFMFVRNPYDRLLSAFKNKIENKHPNPAGDGTYERIVGGVKKLRYNAPTKNASVTFGEFLNYVLFTVGHGINIDVHFAPYINLLNPCSLKFDFIGKMETFSRDAPIIMKHLFGKKTQLPKKNRSKHKKSSKDYYSNVRDDIIEKIHDLYKDDFEMYGYGFPDYVKKTL